MSIAQRIYLFLCVLCAVVFMIMLKLRAEVARLKEARAWKESDPEIRKAERERILALVKKHTWDYNLPHYPPTGVMGCSPSFTRVKILNMGFFEEVNK